MRKSAKKISEDLKKVDQQSAKKIFQRNCYKKKF